MQAMADAVENTDFVILCMSDSYKRSVYCQAEAEYAFRCKRRLLPIIVRQGYRADGWLGLVIGSRIYVDFGRLDFKQACELVLKEIALQRESQLNNTSTMSGFTISDKYSYDLSQDMVPLTSPMSETMKQSNLPNEYITRNTIRSKYRSISVSEWAKKDILDFLYDTRLYYMMPICELMTGHGLVKLFRMCQTKPTRFYSQLNDELVSRFNGLHLPIGIYTQFLSEMDRLVDASSAEAIEEEDSKYSQSSSSISESSVSSPPPTPTIIEDNTKTSNPNKLLEPSIQVNSISSSVQTTSPTITTIQTSCNVQITEQTAYRTESIGIPSTNFIVVSSQDSSSTRSQQTELILINE